MTLKDADAIKAELRKRLDDGLLYTLADVIEVIDELPTIDPVKHGKWLPYEFGDYHWHKCSVCGTGDCYIVTVDRSERGYGKHDIESVRNYCPNCGAKMDKEKEDV